MVVISPVGLVVNILPRPRLAAALSPLLPVQGPAGGNSS